MRVLSRNPRTHEPVDTTVTDQNVDGRIAHPMAALDEHRLAASSRLQGLGLPHHLILGAGLVRAQQHGGFRNVGGD
jgi:hypothetical protein